MNSENIFDIIYVLTYIYIIQLNTFSTDLVGKQLREYISGNRNAHHIINFIFILVLLSVFDRNSSITKLLGDTVIVYFFYLLTTKVDLQFNIIILLSILFFYFYKREIEIKKNRISGDSEIDKNTKNIIMKNEISRTQLFQFSIVGLTTIFAFYYYNRKNIQYGGNFSYNKFLFC